MSESSVDRDPFELIADSFLVRFRSGERPGVEEYAARHPELADQIRALLPALVMVEQNLSIAELPAGPSGLGSSPADGAPRQLGDFRIVREIGRGGMGVVYEAVQQSLGRRVALKVLPWSSFGDRSRLERFQLEARAVARLHHTNIVPVFGVGEQEGTHFFAMQFIQGQGLDVIIEEVGRLRDGGPAATAAAGSLAHALLRTVAVEMTSGQPAEGADAPGRGDATLRSPRTEPFAPAPAAADPSAPFLSECSGLTASERHYFRGVARIALQVAEALAHAHDQGVLHRDIKPSNLMMDPQGVVWVTDFGLAKADGNEGPTRTGDVVGTLRYMAPERFEGRSDPRSDLYALGATLYELLTLRPIFDDLSRARLIEHVMHREPVPPRSIDPRTPRDLEVVCLKCLAKEPSRRYQTAGELAEELRRFLAGEPIRARQSGPVERAWRWARRNPAVAALLTALAASLLAGLAGVSWQWWRAEAAAARNQGLARLAEEGHRSALGAARNERAARQELQQVNTLLLEAQGELKSTLYATRTNLAMAAYNSNSIGRVRDLLDLLQPAAGEPDPRGFEWYLLHALSHQEERTFEGLEAEESSVSESSEHHLVSVQRVTYSPDGRRIAAGGWDGKILIRDVNSGRIALTINAHQQRVNGLAFRPDGRQLASASPDRTIKLWDAGAGRLLRTIPSADGMVYSVAYSPDGRRLATGFEGSYRIWDADGGQIVRSFPAAHDGIVTGLAFHPDGRRLASVGHDRLVKLWDAESGRLIRTLKGHTDQLQTVAFDGDGRTLATAGLDGTVRIWDAESGRHTLTLTGHSGAIYGVAFSPDGTRIASAGSDQAVIFWDAETGRELSRLRGHSDLITSLSFRPDGRRLASSSFDHTVRIWDPGRPPAPRTLHSPGGWVHAVALSSDGRWIVSGEVRGLRIWDLETGRQRAIQEGPGVDVGCVAFRPDGRRVASGDLDGTVRVWEASSGRLVATLRGHAQAVTCVAYSRDGARIFTGSRDRTIRIWDARSGRVLRVLRGHTDGLHCLAISPDGLEFATGSGDSTIRIWDAESGAERLRLRGHHDGVVSLAYSPDGRRLASGGRDRSIRTWDARSGRPGLTILLHARRVSGLAYSPDGRRIASASSDGAIKLFDVASGQDLITLLGHPGWVDVVAFNADGRRLVSAGSNRMIQVWEAAHAESKRAPEGSGDRTFE